MAADYLSDQEISDFKDAFVLFDKGSFILTNYL